MKTGCIAVVFLFCVSQGFCEDKAATINKNVTVISAQTSADGASQVSKELLDECIVSLPKAADIEPFVDAKVLYVRDVNGKKDSNKYVNTFVAHVEIHYLMRQREMIIITSNSVPSQSPVIKEVTRMVPRCDTVYSAAQEGDVFAGTTPRTYYFTKQEDAAKSAQSRAATWIKQHEPILCR
jgi:hypothetical protein